jgi:hypothetical protein
MGWAVRCREHALDIANEVFFITNASFDSKKRIRQHIWCAFQKTVD